LGRAYPEKYAEWLENVVEQSQPLATGERLVFINAWSERAEGNHLEPCERCGRACLEATRTVLDSLDPRPGTICAGSGKR
jgi:Glycosyltransferase WbsX